MLDLLRAARNAEIKKINKAEQDSILAAIDNAKRALAAFRQSPDYQQAKERTKEPNKMDLENHAREIAMQRIEALRRARTEHPDAFQDYNTPPLAKSSRDFDSLVEAEIKKGFPANVAAQRVATVYGVHPRKENASMSETPESDANAPTDERGVPLRSYSIPGGPLPHNLPGTRLPKKSDYERGSLKDRAGNRGL